MRFTLLYGFLVLCFLLVLLAAFVFHGILSWAVGLVYIAYDSFIQCVVVYISANRLDRNRKEKPVSQQAPNPLPTLSVVIPARNERSVLPDCIRALHAQTRAPEEIIIVDDGSTDGTAEWLEEFSKSNTHIPLRVVRKTQSGKADSLNTGWQMSKSEIVVTVDADTVLDPGALMEMARAFAKDPNLSAAGGVLMPRCRGSNPAKMFEFYQHFEYIRSFLERFAWESVGSLILVSGAFSAFRRNILVELGGFDKNSMVEDYELIYRLYRHCYDRGQNTCVRVVPRARAFTDAPATLRGFLLQRSRWFAGFLETLFRNRDMVANPRYGIFGKFMLPLKLIDTLKPVYGLLALIIFLSFLAAGFRPYLLILYILAGKLFFDLALHCYSFILFHRWQEERIGFILWTRSMGALLTEPFGFQILRHVAAIMGMIAYSSGRIGWTQERQIQAKGAMI